MVTPDVGLMIIVVDFGRRFENSPAVNLTRLSGLEWSVSYRTTLVSIGLVPV